MKKLRPNARIVVTDHAVLRWLEREHGVDIDAIRAHLCGKVLTAAQLGAVAVKTDHVRLVLVEHDQPGNDVVITTALPRNSTLPGLHPRDGRSRDIGRDND